MSISTKPYLLQGNRRNKKTAPGSTLPEQSRSSPTATHLQSDRSETLQKVQEFLEIIMKLTAGGASLPPNLSLACGSMLSNTRDCCFSFCYPVNCRSGYSPYPCRCHTILRPPECLASVISSCNDSHRLNHTGK